MSGVASRRSSQLVLRVELSSVMSEPIAMCFSGGKDSALALQDIRRRGVYHVAELLTTVTDAYDRVSMHGVRRTLLREQAAAIGIPLSEVVVPPESSNDVYEHEMGKAFARVRADGIRRVAFGDIFLEDLRTYRERQLASWDLECLFPLWKQDTATLARSFIGDGFEAITVCVNPAALGASFAGRAFDDAFLTDLPPDVDPCGENGEFHTFVFDGPIFSRPIAASRGTVVERAGFVFCDVLHQRGGTNGLHRG